MRTVKFMITLVMLLFLSFCVKSNKDITLSLRIFNFDYIDNGQPNVFVNHHRPILIKDYDVYISNIDPFYSTYDADYFYQESYFDKYSLLIIPLLDHKMPEYSIDSYLLENQHLDLTIKKSIPIQKTQEYGYLESLVHLLIEIDTTYIESFKIKYQEEKLYVFDSFILNQQDFDIPLGISYYKDYETFSSVFSNIAVFPFRGEEVLSNYESSLFNDYYVLSFYKEDVTSGHFLVLEDIYLNKTPDNKLTYIIGMKGNSTSAHLSNVLLIIMIDKTVLIDNETLHEFIIT